MFMANIRSEKYLAGLDAGQRAEIEQYLHDMKTGPADGEQDIEWQGTGRGYYYHLHALESLTDETEKAAYRKKLDADIAAWLAEDPRNYMVKMVKVTLAGG